MLERVSYLGKHIPKMAGGAKRKHREVSSLQPEPRPAKHAPDVCTTQAQGQATGLAGLGLILNLGGAQFSSLAVLSAHPDSPYDAAVVDSTDVPAKWRNSPAYYIANDIRGKAVEFKCASKENDSLTFSENQRGALEQVGLKIAFSSHKFVFILTR